MLEQGWVFACISPPKKHRDGHDDTFSFVFVLFTHSDGVHREFTQGKVLLEKLERQL
jgi:hypothetical protein